MLKLLAELGSCFDTASVVEIELALAAGATPDRISFGNTIKKERDIVRALELGVRLFAVDCEAEVEKIARAAATAGIAASDVKVFCRILCDGAGAEWPLSRKFGCVPEMAVDVLEHAYRQGLEAYGVSFHVGSQQRNTEAWDQALASASAIFRECATRGIHLSMVNLGGGFPTKYLKSVPAVEALRRVDLPGAVEALRQPSPGDDHRAGPRHGRQCGHHRGRGRSRLEEEPDEDEVRWVYLDIGKFGGLAETMDESIRYPIRTEHDDDRKVPCVLAGPTCDSADVLYEKEPYPLPISLEIGDKVLIEGTGAYTTTYSAVAFNGFPPLEVLRDLDSRPACLADRGRHQPSPSVVPDGRLGIEQVRGLSLTPRTGGHGHDHDTPRNHARCRSARGIARFLLRTPTGSRRPANACAKAACRREGLSLVIERDGEPDRHRAPVARFAPAPNRPALMLGPIAIDPSCQGLGLGAKLMREALAAQHGARVTRPSCWWAMLPITSASASRRKSTGRSGCRALTSASASSALRARGGRARRRARARLGDR